MMNNLVRVVILYLGVFPLSVLASPAASTLYLDRTQTIFSLNIANDSNDIYFHFESKAHRAWVAVGAGGEMKNALMLMMYPSKNNKNVTLSPRIAKGTIEPTYVPDIQVEILSGTTIEKNKMIVNAVCHNCRSWKGGALEVSPTEPWMYAFGPTGNPINSDSLRADLTQHDYYGKFTMDMVQATGSGGLPAAEAIMSGVTLVGHQYIKDGDFLSQTHGWTMASLVVIFGPILVLHLVSGARFRWISHLFFGVVLVVGLATGIYDSTYYNRSKHWDTSHQIIGFTALGCLIIIILFGVVSQHHFRREGVIRLLLSNIVGLAASAWILALVDGFLGVKLADSKNSIYIAYGCSIVASILVFIGLLILVLRRRATRQHNKDVRDAGVVPLH